MLAVHEIPVLLATFPPHCVLVSAWLTKVKNPGRLFVADFRDPWIYDTRKNSGDIFPWFNRQMVCAILRRADLILAVSRANLQKLADAAGSDLAGKCLYMPNCVDLKLYEGVEEIRSAQEGKIAMGHLGDLDYEHRDPRPFFNALNLLSEKKPPLFGELEIHFWGDSGRWGGMDLSHLIDSVGLGKKVFYHGVVDHKAALGIVKGLDVLVLFALDQPLQVPAKTYEYLLSGKPILAFCEEHSETHAVLRRFEDVVIVTSADSQAISLGLEKIVAAVKGRKWEGYARDLSEFDYDEVFSPLYSRLEEMLGDRGWT